MAKQKTFTLKEANMLLPVLDSLIKRAVEGKELVEQLEKEFQDLHHKIFLAGGTLVNITEVSLRKATRDKAVQSIKDSIAEIHATGVQVKDLDKGLLDFPAEVEGEIVLLCWKIGEGHNIQHWHGVEEGFAGRKPIATLFKDSEKPN
ncbi:MAG TPA: DUF2203 domain-containing protein [Terriglobales bacterium]|nr:DUF2203 domain-containing protein [Terriglobales bacterium]